MESMERRRVRNVAFRKRCKGQVPTRVQEGDFLTIHYGGYNRKFIANRNFCMDAAVCKAIEVITEQENSLPCEVTQGQVIVYLKTNGYVRLFTERVHRVFLTKVLNEALEFYGEEK